MGIQPHPAEKTQQGPVAQRDGTLLFSLRSLRGSVGVPFANGASGGALISDDLQSVAKNPSSLETSMPRPFVYEFHRLDLDTSPVFPGNCPNGLFLESIRTAIKTERAKFSHMRLQQGRHRFTIKEQDVAVMNHLMLKLDSTYLVP